MMDKIITGILLTIVIAIIIAVAIVAAAPYLLAGLVSVVFIRMVVGPSVIENARRQASLTRIERS